MSEHPLPEHPLPERALPERADGRPIPAPPLADDDGSASAELTDRLSLFAAGSVGGEAVLEALARSRLLVPVVAGGAEPRHEKDRHEKDRHEKDRHEKHSSMATVLAQGRDGGRSLLAFTSTDAMSCWRADARPVPLAAPLAARAALDEGAQALLIDIAGPTSFAVSGVELLLVAAVSRSQGDACNDPVLLAALRRLISAETRIDSAWLRPAPRREAPATLTFAIHGSDRSWLGGFVQLMASDRVVAQLLPEGLRVRVDLSDTPGAVLWPAPSL